MHCAQLDPFLASAGHVLGMSVDAGPADAPAPPPGDPEVLASVSITGPLPGTLTAAFPRSTALRLAGLFAGRIIGPDADDDLADAIGEIVDMIAGRAATTRHHRTPPTVTIRHGLLGARMPEADGARIACCCAAGEFTLAFRPAPAEVGRVSPTSPEPSATRRS